MTDLSERLRKLADEVGDAFGSDEPPEELNLGDRAYFAMHEAARVLEEKPPKEYLTDDEKEALDLTAKLANLLFKICREPQRPEGHSASLEQWVANKNNDMNECAYEIHVIQHRIMAQAAARAYPELFRGMGSILQRSSS